MAEIADYTKLGILPLQHHSHAGEDYPLDARVAVYAGRIRIITDEDGLPRPSVEDPVDGDTLGDLNGANLWPKGPYRATPGWAFGWPAVGADPGAAGAAVAQQPPRGQTYPAFDPDWLADTHYRTKPVSPPPGRPRPGPGEPGLVMAASDPEAQHDLWLPVLGAPLIADHVTPVDYSTIVADVTRDGVTSPIRRGGLQYLTQVTRPKTAPSWQPSLNLRSPGNPRQTVAGQDRRQEARGGQGMFVEDGDHLGHLAHGHDQGGPIFADPTCEKHLYGRMSGDGVTFTEHAGHISTLAFFKKPGDPRKDAPVDFKEPDFIPSGHPPIPQQAEIRYDPNPQHNWNRQKKEGLWRINYWLRSRTPVPIRPPEEPPPPEVPPPIIPPPGDPPPPIVPPPEPPGRPPGSPVTGDPPTPKPPSPVTGDPPDGQGSKPPTPEGGGGVQRPRGPITQEAQEEKQRRIREARARAAAEAAAAGPAQDGPGPGAAAEEPNETASKSSTILPQPVMPAAGRESYFPLTGSPYSPPPAGDTAAEPWQANQAAQAWQRFNEGPRGVHLQAFAQQDLMGYPVLQERSGADLMRRRAPAHATLYLTPPEVDIYDPAVNYDPAGAPRHYVGLHPNLTLAIATTPAADGSAPVDGWHLQKGQTQAGQEDALLVKPVDGDGVLAAGKAVEFTGGLIVLTPCEDPAFPGEAGGLRHNGDTNRPQWHDGVDWQDYLLASDPVPAHTHVPADVAGLEDALTYLVPTGAVIPFAGGAAPAGWLLCTGAEVSRAAYAALFDLIGETYGAGDGLTTFNLPNLKGRVVVGMDGDDTDFGALDHSGGAKTHVLTIEEMPAHAHDTAGATVELGSHSHTITVNNLPVHDTPYHPAEHGHRYNGGDEAVASKPVKNGQDNGGSIPLTATSDAVDLGTVEIPAGATSTIGGDGAHNNLQPYRVLNYIIKT